MQLTNLTSLTKVSSQAVALQLESQTSHTCANHYTACEVSSVTSDRLFVTPWSVARQAPLSIGFFKQEYESGLPRPPPGDLPNPGIEPKTLTSSALEGRVFTTSTTWKATQHQLPSTGWLKTAFPSSLPFQSASKFKRLFSCILSISVSFLLRYFGKFIHGSSSHSHTVI